MLFQKNEALIITKTSLLNHPKEVNLKNPFNFPLFFNSSFFVFLKYVLFGSVEKEKKCDLFKGQWIQELRGVLYTNSSCATIPDSKNCFKHGRKDKDFLNWRWKPEECELPRFNPKAFLELVRGKKMAFIGDSVARNQLESLICLLSQVSSQFENVIIINVVALWFYSMRLFFI